MSIYWNDGGDLYHYGILGQKWGKRRFQNTDGTLTEEGKRRYGLILTKEDGPFKPSKRRQDYIDQHGINPSEKERNRAKNYTMFRPKSVNSSSKDSIINSMKIPNKSGQEVQKKIISASLKALGGLALTASAVYLYKDKKNRDYVDSLVDKLAESTKKTKDYLTLAKTSQKTVSTARKGLVEDMTSYRNAKSSGNDWDANRLLNRAKGNLKIAKNAADLTEDYLRRAEEYQQKSKAIQDEINLYDKSKNKRKSRK